MKLVDQKVSSDKSFPDFAKNVKSVYTNLIDENRLKKHCQGNPKYEICKRLDLLSSLSNSTAHDFKSIPEDNINYFQQVVLDAVGLCYATGGGLTKAGNELLLGPKKLRRGKMKGTSQAEVARWYFAVLVQGSYQGTKNKRIRDLESHEKLKEYGGKRCDFLIPHEQEEKYDLVECKKVNPHPFKNMTDSVNETIGKTLKNLKMAEKQLNNTYQALKQDSDIMNKHVFIDISYYGKKIETSVGDKHGNNAIIYGFTEEHVKQIQKAIQEDMNEYEIDKVTICYNNSIIITGYPRALIQRSHTINCTNNDSSIEEYKGWSIEMHPKHSTEGIKEIRIAKKQWTWERVRTTYNNLSDSGSFYTVS